MWLIKRSIAQGVIHGMAHGVQNGQRATPDVTSEIPRARCWGRKLGLDRRVVVAMYGPGKGLPAAAVNPNLPHRRRNVK